MRRPFEEILRQYHVEAEKGPSYRLQFELKVAEEILESAKQEALEKLRKRHANTGKSTSNTGKPTSNTVKPTSNTVKPTSNTSNPAKGTSNPGKPPSNSSNPGKSTSKPGKPTSKPGKPTSNPANPANVTTNPTTTNPATTNPATTNPATTNPATTNAATTNPADPNGDSFVKWLKEETTGLYTLILDVLGDLFDTVCRKILTAAEAIKRAVLRLQSSIPSFFSLPPSGTLFLHEG